MKYFVILALLVLLVTPVAAVENAAPREPVRLQSVQAAFIQEKHMKILARPLISHGIFAFQAPQSLRWEYREPLRSILLMHGGKIKKLTDRDGQLVEESGMGVDSMQIVLQDITNWIDGRFTDNPAFSVSFVDKKTILLTPKEPALSAFISRIQLNLAEEEGLMDAVTIFEGPDAYTKLTFSGAVLNREIPASMFTGP